MTAADGVPGQTAKAAYGSLMPGRSLLTVKEVAAALRLTEETVCGYIRRGELRASAMGTDPEGCPCPPYLVRADDLDTLLDARAVVIDGPTPIKRQPTPARGSSKRSRRGAVQLVSPTKAT